MKAEVALVRQPMSRGSLGHERCMPGMVKLIQVKAGMRRSIKLRAELGQSMYSRRQPWIRFRRRAAMWLLAAWAVFTASPVLAACCAPPSHPVHAVAVEVSPEHHAAAQDECCDTETLAQPCPMVLAPDYTVRGQNQQPVALPIQFPLLVPTAAIVQGPTPVPIPPAPPDPIFLRLQRFLI